MFDELYKEAYKKLKNEIRDIAGDLLINNEPHNPYYIGKLRALNEIFDIMNKIDDDLYNALSLELQKESAYYESKLAADESSYEPH